ncbi:MAG: hypothetical protein RLZZ612_833 [Pseudomonadota bacterium]|jgi:anthranilate phosphoribosyltransferase
MGISNYLKEIGRGKDGARSLNRAQAADLLGHILDGQVSDLEIGAFCIAMRVKGETPEEMAGFLDALQQRLALVPPAASSKPTLVLPSYNGARKLPVLTPLLALLLTQAGWPVLIHGCDTEDKRISTEKVLLALGIEALDDTKKAANSQLAFVPTGVLLPSLQHLLNVRRVIGLRNPAHSLVKLMRPVAGPAVLVTSYTHPEYLHSMSATLSQVGTTALLLRGTEGEAVADARRCPAMDAIWQGHIERVQEVQAGPLTQVPDLPPPEAEATAAWIRRVLAGDIPVPPPIATQVQHIIALAERLARTAPATTPSTTLAVESTP